MQIYARRLCPDALFDPRYGQLAGPQARLDGPERGTDGWTDERKISSFYRTLSPIGAAALPPPMKTKEKVEQGKGTADHLMPLGYLLDMSTHL